MDYKDYLKLTDDIHNAITRAKEAGIKFCSTSRSPAEIDLEMYTTSASGRPVRFNRTVQCYEKKEES